MHIEEYRTFCLKMDGVTEEFPFGEGTLVYKAYGKIFALSGIENFASINLKCDPGYAVELREKHDAIIPGYHMNKKHWNTVLLNGTLPDALVRELISDSYNLVVKGVRVSKRNHH